MERELLRECRSEISRLKETIKQKEREIEKMRINNLFLDTIFKEIHEEIMIIDQDFNILEVNKVFLEQYGLDKKDVTGRKCYEVTYNSKGPCDFGDCACPLEKAKKDGRRVEVSHLYGPPGKKRETIRIMYPFKANGEIPDCFVEISRDVTAQRNLINRLQNSEKNLRAILDNATDAILSVNESQKIILFNNAAKYIFGYSLNEVLNKDLRILIPPQYGDHYRYIKRFLETKKPRIIGETISLTALRKNGEEFPIELGLSHNETTDGITFTAIIRDMTEQKELEKKLLQAERLAAVGKTVASVAHEIKNPLMIIGGFSHQVKRGLSDESAIRKLDMVLDEVTRLEKLVRNLGDFTKEYTLVKRPSDINDVIRDVLKIMGELYSTDKYGFTHDLAPDLPEIHCDPDKLKQVFMNVIGNGIEAMEGGGEIAITSKKIPNGVEITIKDEGIGISEENLFNIFEPFFTTREKGSGLGLSISYKIVSAHDGDISATSRPGEGTTFSILLPAGI